MLCGKIRKERSQLGAPGFKWEQAVGIDHVGKLRIDGGARIHDSFAFTIDCQHAVERRVWDMTPS